MGDVDRHWNVEHGDDAKTQAAQMEDKMLDKSDLNDQAGMDADCRRNEARMNEGAASWPNSFQSERSRLRGIFTGMERI